ncbi:MAG: hypothetical protein ACFUZC_04890 [Chthoniobacteraceae bacterium]
MEIKKCPYCGSAECSYKSSSSKRVFNCGTRIWTWFYSSEKERLHRRGGDCYRREIHRLKNGTATASLDCKIEGSELVIRIGVKTLAWASQEKNGGPLGSECRIESASEFADDVATALLDEDEIGNSKLTKTIDLAIQKAADDGSPSLIYKNE